MAPTSASRQAPQRSLCKQEAQGRSRLAPLEEGLTWGHVFTSTPYPVERRGEPYFQFYWNFGNQFSGVWPIEMAVNQQNPENLTQWQWMWAYGP